VNLASLWRSVIQFDRGKANPRVGLRQTIGIVIPLCVAAVMGHAADGMSAGIGALNVAVGDGTDPYVHRARRMLAGSVVCALAIVLGSLGGGTLFMPAILALAAFAAGMMVAIGPAQADIGVIALVTLIVYSAKLVPSHQALVSGLVALGGGLFQTALALALWPLRRSAPERNALANLYRELARAAGENAPATEAPPASRQSTEAQQALATLDARDSVESERYLALLGQAERIRLALLTLARLRIRIGRESSTTAVTAILERCGELASAALQRVGDSLHRDDGMTSAPDLVGEMQRLGEQLRQACRACPEQISPMISDARSTMDALAGQLRTVLELAAHASTEGLSEFERRESAHPWRLRAAGARSTLLANLHLDSATFRHAVRLAVCVAIGEIVARVLGSQRPYWVPMTVALVLKPDFTTTFSRGLQRLLGTLVGLVMATVLVNLLHPGLWAQIASLTLFAFLLRSYGPANYGVLAIGVTGFVVFLFDVGGVPPGDVIVPRGINTMVGGLIALLAYRLWPTWERTQAPEALAHMIDAYRMYFQRVRDGYLHQDAASGVMLDQARLAARIARSGLEASVSRLRAEHATPPERIARFDRILADSHRFIHAVMSLEAGLLTSRPVPPRDAFRKLANDVDFAMYYLSSGLRGSAIEADHFPDLREDHHALLESGNSEVERHALVNTETDRIVNSLNTLIHEILPAIVRR
jgi:uncharacterized membrane protein YccC